MNSTIIPFAQDADFYYNQYQKLYEQDKLPDALAAIRKAVALAPEDGELQLEMSAVLTDMGRYEDSNFILFEIIRKIPELRGDCLFEIGYNFIGEQDFRHAKEMLEQYLEMHPEGDYAEDAIHMISVIETGGADTGNTILEDVEQAGLYSRADAGKRFLDEGDYAQAILMLGEVARKNPALLYAKNNLALAYFCDGDPEAALSVTNEVLEKDPENFHATCNKALFLHELKDQAGEEACLCKLDQMQIESPEEATKLAITLCEIKDHARAVRALLALFQYPIYDMKMMFLLAAAYANTGKLAESIGIFSDMLKIEPMDAPALYYNQKTQEARESGKTIEIPYRYGLPLEVAKEKIAALYELYQSKKEDFVERWKEEAVRALVNWGLLYQDFNVKQLCIVLLMKAEDDRAVEILRRFLMRRKQPDEIKNSVLVALKKLKQPEPYMAYVNDKISYVRVGVVEPEFAMLASHKKVVTLFIKNTGGAGQKFILAALGLWEAYINAVHPGSFKKPQLWAAALEMAARKTVGLPVNPNEIGTRYDVRPSVVSKYARQILKEAKQHEEPTTD